MWIHIGVKIQIALRAGEDERVYLQTEAPESMLQDAPVPPDPSPKGPQPQGNNLHANLNLHASLNLYANFQTYQV